MKTESECEKAESVLVFLSFLEEGVEGVFYGSGIQNFGGVPRREWGSVVFIPGPNYFRKPTTIPFLKHVSTVSIACLVGKVG